MPERVKRTHTTAEATALGLRLFVTSLPFHIDEDILWKDFGECGVLEDVFLMRGPDGKSRGKGMLTFRDDEGAKAALAFNATDYGGRTLYVKVAEPKRVDENAPPKPAREGQEARGERPAKREAAARPTEKPEGCVSLCLKNIGATTEEQLRSFLAECAVQSVRVVYDRVTEEPRGIAFVDFERTKDVDAAMELHGQELNGNPVSMHYEVPKVRPRPEGCLSVVVKTLAPGATEDDVRGLFHGLENNIQEVRIIRDRETKECKGMAFVDFSKPDAVEAAVRRSGMKVGGKTIFVGYETKQKKEREDGKTASKPDGEVKKPKKKKAVEAKEGQEGKGINTEAPESAADKEARLEAKKEKRKKQWEARQQKKKEDEGQEGGAKAAAEPQAADTADAEEAEASLSKMAKKKLKRKAEAAAAAQEEAADAEEEVPAKKAKKAKKKAAAEDE